MSPASDLIANSLAAGRCLLLVLSKPRRGSAPYRKVSLRPVIVKRRELYQATYQFPGKETHENLDGFGAAALVARLLPGVFEHADLFTPEADHTIRVRKGVLQIKSGPPTRKPTPALHNRSKAYLIPPDVPCPFLAAIGVMTESGQVRAAKYHKFRQINRFLELVDDVVPSLPRGRPARVVDFGCGKSYLTFALHHLLHDIHGLSVNILGLDRKADVVADCAALARRLGCPGLEFRTADIIEHDETEPVDLAVSLHACDTATDVALAKAVAWGCRVILAVPCCQHELAPQLSSEALAPLLAHGILRDRFAALATDALRALALEICGYTTQIVEFIDLEHTAKNLLLRAVKRTGQDERRQEKLEQYRRLKQSLGVRSFALDQEPMMKSGA